MAIIKSICRDCLESNMPSCKDSCVKLEVFQEEMYRNKSYLCASDMESTEGYARALAPFHIH